MKWFVITNREKKTNEVFGDDPEKRGKIHFLRNELNALPRRDKDLKVKYVGNSNDAKATKLFVDEIKNELISMAQALEKNKRSLL